MQGMPSLKALAWENLPWCGTSPPLFFIPHPLTARKGEQIASWLNDTILIPLTRSCAIYLEPARTLSTKSQPAHYSQPVQSSLKASHYIWASENRTGWSPLSRLTSATMHSGCVTSGYVTLEIAENFQRRSMIQIPFYTI